jgi:hypothetical protein
MPPTVIARLLIVLGLVRRWNLTEAQVEQMDVRKVRDERT